MKHCKQIFCSKLQYKKKQCTQHLSKTNSDLAYNDNNNNVITEYHISVMSN